MSSFEKSEKTALDLVYEMLHQKMRPAPCVSSLVAKEVFAHPAFSSFAHDRLNSKLLFLALCETVLYVNFESEEDERNVVLKAKELLKDLLGVREDYEFDDVEVDDVYKKLRVMFSLGVSFDMAVARLRLEHPNVIR